MFRNYYCAAKKSAGKVCTSGLPRRAFLCYTPRPIGFPLVFSFDVNHVLFPLTCRCWYYHLHCLFIHNNTSNTYKHLKTAISPTSTFPLLAAPAVIFPSPPPLYHQSPIAVVRCRNRKYSKPTFHAVVRSDIARARTRVFLTCAPTRRRR